MKLRRLNSSSGSIGSRRAPLVQHEQRPAARSRRGRRPTPRAAPAHDRLADQREHRTGEPEHGQHARRASRGAPAARAPARLGTATATSAERDQHERHVDGEDPAPRGGVDEPAAGQRPDHHRDPRPRRPGADRGAALVGREGGDDHRQRARRQQRAEHALQRAAGDQHLDRRRERADAPTRRRTRRRRSRTPAARRRGRRASPRRGSASRASAGRRWRPTAGRRARRRGRRGSPAARR